MFFNGKSLLKRFLMFFNVNLPILMFSYPLVHVEDDDLNNDCCAVDLKDSESDLELIETCFEDACALNVTEKSMLYYICGYIAHKEKIVCSDVNDVVSLLEESEFTVKLLRGKLKLLFRYARQIQMS